MSEILKTECVRQAAVSATLRNGRVNYSRVAVITGLSRADVRRMLEGIDATSSRSTPPRHRVWRLVSAWNEDKRFLDRHGRPRPLQLGECQDGFHDLVRHYCGDVPAKAVLEELRSLGAAQSKDGKVHFRGGAAKRMRRKLSSARGLIRATSKALGQIGAPGSEESPSLLAVALELRNHADQTIIRRRIDATLSSAFEALQSLGERPVTHGGRKTGEPSTVLDVSAIVTMGIRTSNRKI